MREKAWRKGIGRISLYLYIKLTIIGATTSEQFVIVSDASRTGICTALYHPVTGGNDNIGALQWAAAQKCSSMASHYANLAITQLYIKAREWYHLSINPALKWVTSTLWAAWRPTKTRQRRKSNSDVRPSRHLPMLTLPQEQLRKLFLLLDPHLTHPSTHDHHDAFIQVHRALNELFDALSP
jgi:hypothetical protein